MEIKITKKQKLQEINNSMVHNFYYLVYGQIINDDATRYRKFKLVLFFDIWDVLEYIEKDTYTQQDIKNYIDALIDGYMSLIPDYNNVKGFFQVCNDTIERYNKICA